MYSISQFDFAVFYKMSEKMKNRKFCTIEKANWCALTENSNNLNGNQFVKKVMKELKAASPSTFQPCPMKGLISFNVSASKMKNMMDMIPQGEVSRTFKKSYINNNYISIARIVSTQSRYL